MEKSNYAFVFQERTWFAERTERFRWKRNLIYAKISPATLLRRILSALRSSGSLSSVFLEINFIINMSCACGEFGTWFVFIDSIPQTDNGINSIWMPTSFVAQMIGFMPYFVCLFTKKTPVFAFATALQEKKLSPLHFFRRSHAIAYRLERIEE